MAEIKHKIFVLDTNVILHDSTCLYNFQDNDVIIPIPVLEELDHFKKGNETINYHAREFLRALDKLSGDKLFDGGVKLGEKLGTLLIKLETDFNDKLVANFSKANPDHHILNTAYQAAKENPSRTVILVSKDVNLRMKAKAVGLMAEDYTTDHVKKDLSELNTGIVEVSGYPAEKLAPLKDEPYEMSVDVLGLDRRPRTNEYLVFNKEAEHEQVLARVDCEGRVVREVAPRKAYGIMPRNTEQALALDALLDPDIKLVSINGKAGTGKTLLALAAALENVKMYNQICIARPIVALSNKDLGFLPGDVHAKIEPYMQPLYDNLGVIQNQFLETDSRSMLVKQLLEDEKLVISPLAYIRGRSLVGSFFIVDEAQNLTPHEVKTIITRAGEGTKMVFTGDIYQIDHPYLDGFSNGLSYLIERMQSQGMYAHISLQKGERSKLAEIASQLL
jgi:PhoH-like ATPase